MNKKWQQLNLLNKFIQICENENIWYIASGETLYTAVKHNDLFIEKNMPEVSMTSASYGLLKKNYPKLVNDLSMDYKYSELNPRFYFENQKQTKDSFYIDIKIIAPTTIRKAKKFVGLKSMTNYKINNIYSQDAKNTFGDKLLKVFIYPLKRTIKKRNYKGVLNKMKSNKRQGFVEISAPTQSLNDIWLPQITFKTKNIHFNMFEISIPIEYDLILKNRYGKDYMEIKK